MRTDGGTDKARPANATRKTASAEEAGSAGSEKTTKGGDFPRVLSPFAEREKVHSRREERAKERERKSEKINQNNKRTTLSVSVRFQRERRRRL